MDFSGTVLSGCESVLLQAECDDKSRAAFVSQYREIASEKPNVHNGKPGSGTKVSVWFSGTEVAAQNLKMLGHDVETLYAGEYRYVVHGAKFFWTAVRNGFRTGEKRASA